LTINSSKLDDSVKAPERPPIRIPELTKFLVDSHYKWYGVFTKNEKELFKYWKDHISVVYKERKMRLLSMKEQQSYSEMPTMAATGVTKVMTKNEKYLKARNKKHDYSKCFEMDVAYTL
jgi:hypothetical protein